MRGQYGQGSPSTVTSQAKRASSGCQGTRVYERRVGHGQHVGRGGRLADRAGGEAGEAGALLEQVVDRLHRHQLGVRLAVHLDELREEELDPLVLRALADLVVRHGLPSG